MKLFICGSCGHIEFGQAPERCPVCTAPKEKFSQNDKVFEESAANSPEGAVKHVPTITVNKECGMIPDAGCVDVLVRVGKTLHPMEEKHYITFLDLYLDKKYVARKYLTPAMYPAAVFHLKDTGEEVAVVERCNLHGHWLDSAAI
jgi:superoxide reductase